MNELTHFSDATLPSPLSRKITLIDTMPAFERALLRFVECGRLSVRSALMFAGDKVRMQEALGTIAPS